MKRITVNMPDSDYKVVHRLSELNGVSMSSILAELVGVVTPILAQMVSNMEMINKASDELKAQLRESTQNAYDEIMALQDKAFALQTAYSADMARQLDLIIDRQKGERSAVERSSGSDTH